MQKFFPETPDTNAGNIFFQLADRLAAAVQKKTKIHRRIPRAKWAAEFKKLIGDLGNPAEPRICAALVWYEKNIGGQFVPVIYSAGTFRKKFAQVEAAMNRAPAAPETRRLEISRDAETIQRLAGYFIWQHDEQKKTELAMIQISLDRYRNWLVRLATGWTDATDAARAEEQRQIQKTGTTKSSVWEWPRILAHIFRSAEDEIEYVRGWLRSQFNWKNAPHDLTRAAWFHRHPWYIRRLAESVQNYGGEPADVEKILKLGD